MYTCSSLGAGGCEVIGQVVLLRRWGVGSTVSLTLPTGVAKFCLLRNILLCWMYACRDAILLVLEDVKLLAKSCCLDSKAQYLSPLISLRAHIRGSGDQANAPPPSPPPRAALGLRLTCSLHSCLRGHASEAVVTIVYVFVWPSVCIGTCIVAIVYASLWLTSAPIKGVYTERIEANSIMTSFSMFMFRRPGLNSPLKIRLQLRVEASMGKY